MVRGSFRWARLALSFLLVAAGWAGNAHGDPRFDEGNAVRAQFETIRLSINALDVNGVLSALADDASVWTSLDGRAAGLEAIRASLAKRFAGRAKNTYSTTPPRILLEPEQAWVYSEWKWGNEKGAQIARLNPSGGRWRVDRLDLDGKTQQVPEGDFDPRTPVARLLETIATMEQAATAFAEGDFATLERFLRPDFVFVDESGRLYEAPDSFIVAALTGAPDGVDREKMTLYVSWNTNSAIAFQEIKGQRVSLLLIREGGRWQVAQASLSTPIESLAVSPRERLATTWAALRLRE